MAIVFLVTGPIVAPVFFDNPSSKIISSPSEVSVAANLGSSQKGQYAVEEIPLVRQITQPMLSPKSGHSATNFKLSGVVYSEAGSYCLINGKVIKQGEEINGAILKKVTPTEVILDYQGEQITLPVED